MEVFKWIATNWLDVLQSLGIVSGFVFTAHTIRTDSEARKIGNLIAFGQSHQSIWKQLHETSALSRIRDEAADLEAKPLSNEERVFVTSVILHLDSVHRASKAKMFIQMDQFQKDIRALLSLPIPSAVWDEIKVFQDEGFVVFVNECLEEPQPIT